MRHGQLTYSVGSCEISLFCTTVVGTLRMYSTYVPRYLEHLAGDQWMGNTHTSGAPAMVIRRHSRVHTQCTVHTLPPQSPAYPAAAVAHILVHSAAHILPTYQEMGL